MKVLSTKRTAADSADLFVPNSDRVDRLSLLDDSMTRPMVIIVRSFSRQVKSPISEWRPLDAILWRFQQWSSNNLFIINQLPKNKWPSVFAAWEYSCECRPLDAWISLVLMHQLARIYCWSSIIATSYLRLKSRHCLPGQTSRPAGCLVVTNPSDWPPIGTRDQAKYE